MYIIQILQTKHCQFECDRCFVALYNRHDTESVFAAVRTWRCKKFSTKMTYCRSAKLRTKNSSICESYIVYIVILTYLFHLHNKTQYVCLSVADGRPNGWADQDQTWHRESCWPRECFSQGQGHLSVREFMPATPGEQRWTMRALAESVAAAAQ